MKKFLSLFISLFVLAVCVSFSVSAYADDSVIQNTDETIVLNDISDSNCTVDIPFTSTDYTGEAITPAVTVTCNGAVLTENLDYTIAYSNNVNAGFAKVFVTGIGNYSGTVTKDFTIKKLNLAGKGKATVSFDSTTIVYNGESVKPVVYVSYNKGGNEGAQYLAQDIDFTVAYSNNNNITNASVKITGIGNYTGTLTKSFKIYPAAVTNVYVSNVTSSSLVINWSKVSKASGYDIAVYDESKGAFKHLAYVSSKYSSYKATNLIPAKTYRYKVRAYKTIDDRKRYGEYSNETGTLIQPAQVKISSVTKSGNKLTIEWGKVKCSGYQVFYSTDKKFKKNVKSVFVSSSKTSYKVSGINKSKRYYAKVRAYSNYNGKKRYGAKSTVVSSYFSNVYATYSTYYVNNANRTTNLKIASKAISGTIINPGETFSLNKVVGPRTAAKGYKEAPVFTGGDGVENGLGGGICQVASTMFNCVLNANLTINERHQHSQRVSYVPLGRDSAIYGTVEDLKWTNNTKYAIKVEMTVKNGVITCTFYTCKKAKPKKVNLKVTQKGKNFTLKRSVDGKVNYKAYSTY
ncbi:MAG: VanW family protein [Eubacterium sp.]